MRRIAAVPRGNAPARMRHERSARIDARPEKRCPPDRRRAEIAMRSVEPR